MVPNFSDVDTRVESVILKLFRDYGDIHRYAVVSALKDRYPEEELNLAISRLVNEGRLLAKGDMRDKLSLKSNKPQ